MRIPLTVLVAAHLVATTGCVWEPATHEIRVRPRVDDVEKRVLSFELVVPRAAWGERVVYRGIFTAGELRASRDTLEDFCAGYAHPADLERGDVKLIVVESGKVRVIPLPRREGAPRAPYTLYIAVTVPVDVSRAEASWAPDNGEG
jgi:hypothetical protein